MKNVFGNTHLRRMPSLGWIASASAILSACKSSGGATTPVVVTPPPPPPDSLGSPFTPSSPAASSTYGSAYPVLNVPSQWGSNTINVFLSNTAGLASANKVNQYLSTGNDLVSTPDRVGLFTEQLTTSNINTIYGDGEQQLRAAFKLWEDTTGLRFNYVSDVNQSDIAVWSSSYINAIAAAFLPYEATRNKITEGDIFFSTSVLSQGVQSGGRNFDTMLHEIGHSLGLKHPNNYSLTDEEGNTEGLSVTAPDVDYVYGTTLPDIASYTVMTYHAVVAKIGETFFAPATPRAADIFSIRYEYDLLDSPVDAGNTTYDLEQYRLDGELFPVIIDTGGYDTITAASLTSSIPGVMLDLATGFIRYYIETKVSFYDPNSTSSTLYDHDHFSSFVPGTVIEKAIGSSGSDLLIAPLAGGDRSAVVPDNVTVQPADISGGYGRDILMVAAQDSVYGGGGHDVIGVACQVTVADIGYMVTKHGLGSLGLQTSVALEFLTWREADKWKSYSEILRAAENSSSSSSSEALVSANEIVDTSAVSEIVVKNSSSGGIINGGDGTDLIFIQAGVSGIGSVYGGAGADVFVFCTTEIAPSSFSAVEISDFALTEDRLDFSELNASGWSSTSGADADGDYTDIMLQIGTDSVAIARLDDLSSAGAISIFI